MQVPSRRRLAAPKAAALALASLAVLAPTIGGSAAQAGEPARAQQSVNQVVTTGTPATPVQLQLVQNVLASVAQTEQLVLNSPLLADLTTTITNLLSTLLGNNVTANLVPVNELLQFTKMIRNSVAEAGLTLSDATVTVGEIDATVNANIISATVPMTHTWHEAEPGETNTTLVSMTDNYMLTIKPTAVVNILRLDTIAVEAEGAQTMDEPAPAPAGETEIPNPDDSDESSTTPPASFTAQGAASQPGAAVAQPQIQTAAYTAAATPTNTFDPSVFANYLKDWTAPPNDGDKANDFNSYYPRYSNNCANFVSQGFHQAGWYLATGTNPYADGNWDFNLLGPAGASRTWSEAKSLYAYAKNKKGLDVMGNIWDARKGAQYYMDWDGNKVINHVAAVTGRTAGGVPRISQKTVNRHNLLLTTWKAIVDKDNPKVLWYGLQEVS